MSPGGIYAITNLDDGRGTTYVGSTIGPFGKRWREHRGALRRSDHYNSHLQRAWSKYGECSFMFVVLEVVDDSSSLVEREQYWLDTYCAAGEVYNLGMVVDCPMRGRQHTDSTKQKLSEIARGRTGEKNPFYGKTHSEATKHRFSEIAKNRKLSEETRRKIGASHKGRKQSLEHRRKRAEARRGHPVSEETRRKISDALARPYPPFRSLRTGEVIPAGRNLKKLCRDRGLDRRNMFAVKNGKCRQHKGWVLA